MMVTGFWQKKGRHDLTAQEKAVAGLRISAGFLRITSAEVARRDHQAVLADS
jgi:hypothetical protein